MLPLTLTLSPLKEWGEGMRVEISELNSIFTLDVRKGGELFPSPLRGGWRVSAGWGSGELR